MMPWAAHGRLEAPDCERVVGGALAQPVNAVTSLAFVAVGLAVVLARRRDDASHRESTVYALLLIAIGLGSFAFHGPQPVGSQLAHDVPILVTLAFVLVYDLHRLGWLRRTLPAVAGAAVASTVLWVLAPGGAAWFIVALGASAVAAEYRCHRRHRLQWPTGPVTASHALAVLVVIAGLVWLGGRSSSNLCDPDSRYQLHGLWHVLSAMVLGIWWLAAGRSSDRGANL